MTEFRETVEGQDFIASGASRETSPEIMAAIAFFARDTSEAEALWAGDGFGKVCYPSDIWEYVTSNGVHEPTDYFWGTAGSNWWDHING